MKNAAKEITLEQIRTAQIEIATAMSQVDAKSSQQELEKASIHLRNLERALVAAIGKELIATLKRESIMLNTVTEEMNQASERLFNIVTILRNVVKYTGQVIDVLELIK